VYSIANRYKTLILNRAAFILIAETLVPTHAAVIPSHAAAILSRATVILRRAMVIHKRATVVRRRATVVLIRAMVIPSRAAVVREHATVVRRRVVAIRKRATVVLMRVAINFIDAGNVLFDAGCRALNRATARSHHAICSLRQVSCRNGYVADRAEVFQTDRVARALEDVPVALARTEHGDVRLAVAIIIGWHEHIARDAP